jgi:hypothetical protein
VSTARPSPTTARSLTSAPVPPHSRQALRVMAVGLALGLVALAAPLVDQLNAGDLAAHLRSVYAGTGVGAPAASTLAAYLVGLEVLGTLAWVLTMRVVLPCSPPRHGGARGGHCGRAPIPPATEPPRAGAYSPRGLGRARTSPRRSAIPPRATGHPGGTSRARPGWA